MNERETLKINEKGHLEIGGADTVTLAEKFGTPLYLFDEAYIRQMMRVYRKTIEEKYNGNGLALYASKAFSCKAIYRIADEENIGVERNGIGIRSSTKIAEALGIGFTSITEDDKYATAVEITTL